MMGETEHEASPKPGCSSRDTPNISISNHNSNAAVVGKSTPSSERPVSPISDSPSPSLRAAAGDSLRVYERSPSRREIERLGALLAKLNIKFTDCTFTYKESHLGACCSKRTSSSKSRVKKFREKLSSMIEQLSISLRVEPDVEYKSCEFVPKTMEEDVHCYMRKNYPEMKLKFENCKFVMRGSTFFEKAARKLRGIFGIIFELTYPDGTVVVDDYSFRLKDISIIISYIEERIVEKG